MRLVRHDEDFNKSLKCTLKRCGFSSKVFRRKILRSIHCTGYKVSEIQRLIVEEDANTHALHLIVIFDDLLLLDRQLTAGK